MYYFEAWIYSFFKKQQFSDKKNANALGKKVLNKDCSEDFVINLYLL